MRYAGAYQFLVPQPSTQPARQWLLERIYSGTGSGLALMFFKLNAYSFNVDLFFFGLWCVLSGYLIFRSTFLPRILGGLLAISGLGYLTYLYPPLAYRLFIPY